MSPSKEVPTEIANLASDYISKKNGLTAEGNNSDDFTAWERGIPGATTTYRIGSAEQLFSFRKNHLITFTNYLSAEKTGKTRIIYPEADSKIIDEAILESRRFVERVKNDFVIAKNAGVKF